MIYRCVTPWVRAGLVACFVATAVAARGDSQEEAYRRAITERVAKLTAAMSFDDDAQQARVRQLIAEQYHTLRDIHATRDSARLEKPEDGAAVATTQLALFEAHVRFVSRLRAELSCEQVEQVKDGMTYGVLGHTYNGYLAQLPKLDDEHKRVIRSLLIEARELAMDGGSAEEKHGIFRKYKGKINNYLSAAGHKL